VSGEKFASLRPRPENAPLPVPPRNRRLDFPERVLRAGLEIVRLGRAARLPGADRAIAAPPAAPALPVKGQRVPSDPFLLGAGAEHMPNRAPHCRQGDIVDRRRRLGKPDRPDQAVDEMPIRMNARRIACHSIAAARHNPAPEDKGLANGRDIPQAHHRPRTVKNRGARDRPCKILNHKGGGRIRPLFQQEETP
jgi:hypothetical protein